MYIYIYILYCLLYCLLCCLLYCLLNCLLMGQGSWAGPFWFRPGLGGGEGGGWVWGRAKGPGPDRLGFRPFRPGLGVGWGGGRGDPFSKSTTFKCFQFKKSEDHLIYDYIFTVFLNLYPNRFCFISEPHELVWKSV